MSGAGLHSVLGQLRRMISAEAAGTVADSELLRRFTRRRDEAAFEALLWRHGPMVLGLCRRILRDPHSAEDAFQAVFLILVRDATSIGKRASLASWLYKVAYRVALHTRMRNSRIASPAPCVDRLPDRAADTSGPELRSLLDEAIGELPARYRLPVVLFYLEGKLLREIAKELNCPIATISSRLRRARDMLRRRLARHGLTLTAAALGASIAEQALWAAVPLALARSTAKAGMLCAVANAPATAGVSPSAVSLVEAVSRTMFVTKLKVAALIVVALGVLAAGATALVLQQAHRRTQDQSRLVLVITPAAPEKQKPLPAASGKMIAVKGRVFGPDKKPFAGARLYLPHLLKERPQTPADVQLAQRCTSDASGLFRTTVSTIDTGLQFRFAFAALAEGYGLDWASLRNGPPYDFTLRLVPDQVIEGRLVSMEGQPLGDVKVSVVNVIAAPDENLDPFLKRWKEQPWADELGMKRLDGPTVDILPHTHTDKHGRFRIAGVGRERVAVLSLEGESVALANIHVVTRPGFEPAPINQAASREMQRMGLPPASRLYGPNFVYASPPPVVIEGTVRESGTGRPVAGVHVHGHVNFSSRSAHAVSDEQGRYRLVGLPKTSYYSVYAWGEEKGPWLPCARSVADKGGLEPMRLNIDLVRGVVVKGRVLERATGTGVRATMHVIPLAGYKFAEAAPDYFPLNRYIESMPDDGSFRVVTVPGSSVLTAQCSSAGQFYADQRLNPYRIARLSLEERTRLGAVERSDGFETVTTSLPAFGNNSEDLTSNAYKLLDVPSDTKELTCDLYVDRGKTLGVSVQDSDGKPLKGALVSGMTDSWPTAYRLKDATCKLYGLDPNRPRPVIFYHPERKQGARVFIRGDEPQPLAIRLKSLGTVTGRALDAAGRPAAGVSLALLLPYRARELFNLIGRSEPVETALTDQNGRFRLEGLIPDVDFELALVRSDLQKKSAAMPALGPVGMQRPGRVGPKRVGAGATLDVGDIAIAAKKR